MKRRSMVALGAIGAVGLLSPLLILPTAHWALALVAWVQHAGALGVVVFALVYVVATLALLPGSILTLGAGFAYGPIWGTLLVSPVSVFAAALAFGLGRTVARGWVARETAKHPRLGAIDEAVGEGGFKIVLLLRLSPIVPFNLLNYALGPTRVRFRDYLAASLLGMLPGTLLYVYLGSLVTSATELLGGKPPSAGPWRSVFYWGGLAATLLATVLLTRGARRALERTLAKAPAGGEPEGTR